MATARAPGVAVLRRADRLPQQGSGPLAPGSRRLPSPRAMAAPGGSEAAGRCPLLSFLLLLLIAGPALGWKDPGECCRRPALSASAQRPSGRQFRSPPLGPLALISHFHLLPYSPAPYLSLLLFPDVLRDKWGLLGSRWGGTILYSYGPLSPFPGLPEFVCLFLSRTTILIPKNSWKARLSPAPLALLS